MGQEGLYQGVRNEVCRQQYGKPYLKVGGMVQELE